MSKLFPWPPKPNVTSDEADTLQLLITDLRTQLDAAHKKLEDREREYDIRFVTDFQIGQMVELGLGSGKCIYMQSLLNEYRRLLVACKHAVIQQDSFPSFWLNIIREAVQNAEKVKPLGVG